MKHTSRSMLFFHGENLFIYLSVKSFLYRNFSNFTKEIVRNRTILKINTRIQNLLKSIQFFVRIILSIEYHPFVNSILLSILLKQQTKNPKKYHLSKTYHFSIINLKKKEEEAIRNGKDFQNFEQQDRKDRKVKRESYSSESWKWSDLLIFDEITRGSFTPVVSFRPLCRLARKKAGTSPSPVFTIRKLSCWPGQ